MTAILVSHLNINVNRGGGWQQVMSALIASRMGVVSDLVIESAIITGRQNIGVLCATMEGGTVRNVRITGGSVTTNGFPEGWSTLDVLMTGNSVLRDASRSIYFTHVGGLAGVVC